MKIPVDKHNFINYNKFDDTGSVFIVEVNPKGKSVRYQYDGVGCFPGEVEGFLNNHFHSDLKWFSREHWYSMTRWGENYPKDIVQSTPETDAIMKNEMLWGIEDDAQFDKMMDDVHHEVAKWGFPTKIILQEILAETIEKTGIEWELGCELDSYDVEWWEAKIPLKYKGKEYLLTWENCD